MSVMSNQEFARLWSAKMHLAKSVKKMDALAEEIENWYWQNSPVAY